jgi:hypothetical protein
MRVGAPVDDRRLCIDEPDPNRSRNTRTIQLYSIICAARAICQGKLHTDKSRGAIRVFTVHPGSEGVLRLRCEVDVSGPARAACACARACWRRRTLHCAWRSLPPAAARGSGQPRWIGSRLSGTTTSTKTQCSTTSLTFHRPALRWCYPRPPSQTRSHRAQGSPTSTRHWRASSQLWTRRWGRGSLRSATRSE